MAVTLEAGPGAATVVISRSPVGILCRRTSTTVARNPPRQRPSTGTPTREVTMADQRGMAVGTHLTMATPPTFDSVDAERAHRKAVLAAAFRMFSKAGLD